VGASVTPSGHLQITGAKGARKWRAYWQDADGKHARILGPAHVRDSGKKTARGGTIWRAGNGPKPTPAHLTPDEAEIRLRALLAAAPVVRTPPRDAEKTFGAACDEWLRYIEQERQRTASTVRGYRGIVRTLLLPAFGAETPLSAITTRDIDRWTGRLLTEGRLSRRSVQQALVLLNGALRRAKRLGWVASNAAEDAERISVTSSGDFTALTVEEVHAVARAAADEQDAALYVTAAFTGLRMGELRALRWRDVDFAKRTVHVRRNLPSAGVERVPKSGKVRSVPLIDQAAGPLAELGQREHFTRPTDYVFVRAVGGPLDDAKMRKRFKDALKAAGVERYVRFHDLRHTFGTLAVQAFALTDVKAYMGHADVGTTMRYVHHVPQHDAAERLSAALAAESGALVA
jgi:integrase